MVLQWGFPVSPWTVPTLSVLIDGTLSKERVAYATGQRIQFSPGFSIWLLITKFHTQNCLWKKIQNTQLPLSPVLALLKKNPLWVKGSSNRNSMLTHAGVSFQWHHLSVWLCQTGRSSHYRIQNQHLEQIQLERSQVSKGLAIHGPLFHSLGFISWDLYL